MGRPEMAYLKTLATSLAFFGIGAAAWALLAWECTLGVAAGSYGVATFRTSPGLAGFILALQAALGSGFLFAGAETLFGRPGAGDRPRRRSPLRAIGAAIVAGLAGVAGLLGVWAAVDLIIGAVRAVLGLQDDLFSKAMIGFFMLGSIGVFITLLISMIIKPAWARLAPYLRALWRR